MIFKRIDVFKNLKNGVKIMGKKNVLKLEPVTQQAGDAKEEALKTALLKIEQAQGIGSIMKLGDRPQKDFDVISTSCVSLDLALGIGGIPKGRIIEIYGPESSGKTTLALHIAAEAMKKEGTNVLFIDAEHALDPVYAKSLGVKTEELLISQPDDGNQALEILEKMVRSGAIDLAIVDSVAALVPQEEISGEMGQATVGLQARLMSQACRKLASCIQKSNTAVIFLNQLREKVGESNLSFKPQEVTTGGRALKFYSSVRMDIRRVENIKLKKDVFIGCRTKVKVTKNKMAPPFKTSEFDIYYGKGICKELDVLDYGTEIGVVQKSGSWYQFNELRLGQGRPNVKIFLEENPEVYEEIKAAVIKKSNDEETSLQKEESSDEIESNEENTLTDEDIDFMEDMRFDANF